jgi:hypothetical protein
MSKETLTTPLPRYSLGDCELIARKNGGLVYVSDVVNMLRDLTDDDHAEVMLEKIEKRLEELNV